MINMLENYSIVKNWLNNNTIGIALPDFQPSMLISIITLEQLESYMNNEKYITFNNEDISKNGGYYKTLESLKPESVQRFNLHRYLNQLVRFFNYKYNYVEYSKYLINNEDTHKNIFNEYKSESEIKNKEDLLNYFVKENKALYEYLFYKNIVENI